MLANTKKPQPLNGKKENNLPKKEPYEKIS
jgi:hypothetical protein